MIRRAWEAVVLFCKEMVFALCVAVDRDDDGLPFDDEIVETVSVDVPSECRFTMATKRDDLVEALRKHAQATTG